MKRFFNWLAENANPNIRIEDGKLRQALGAKAEEMIDGIHHRHNQSSNLNVAHFLQEVQTKLAQYPLLQNLMRALQSKNIRYIYDHIDKLRKWVNDLPFRQSEPQRAVARSIYTYLDTLEESDPKASEQEIRQQAEIALKGSLQEMQKLVQVIGDAVSRITQWTGSPILIQPHASETEYGVALEPAKDAQITVGSSDWSPSFTLFQHDEEGIVIDDVIEGGDTDFFQSPQVQSDYFNLVNELRKPGSTGKGKIITLYTARPVEDRKSILKANTLPTNVFLSNDYSHVEGLAHDLSSGKPRDIWKVRIDSRYLTQTLDGRVKYYQVTSSDAPVVKIELITPSDA